MDKKKWSLIACIEYIIAVIILGYIDLKFALTNPTFFNILVAILHIPFVFVMVVCLIKSVVDYKQAKQEQQTDKDIPKDN